MLVYGDQSETVDVGERLRAIGDQLGSAAQRAPGMERHSALVRALIEAGQLLQGMEDRGAPTADLDRFLRALARAVVRSSDSDFRDFGALPPTPSLEWPEPLTMRVPEGFAFYAVYPEAYIAAARQLRLLGVARVIGIRSIGTTLGAIVAAALRAPPAITVRPFGDPFARKVALPESTIVADAHYVIVDEGPGLSGSSFGCVADWLEARGVAPNRIAFLPSHGGELGPQASDRHRRRWKQAQRVAAGFDPGFLLQRFGALEPFSIGHPWERTKFLADRRGKRVLVKFAGLGAIGERKLEIARLLHAAGLSPEPLELVHGFLVERWRGDGRPLLPRENPVEEIGRYLGTRARLFPAREESGASIEKLIEMSRRNISLAFDEETARGALRWNPKDLLRAVTRIRTDNKLDRCEWLRLPDGRILKTDALDHHQAHDLIGCQDIAWDVAAGITEFELNQSEAHRLVLACAYIVDPRLLSFYRVAYAAFRLGQTNLCGTADDLYRNSIRQLLLERTARESAEILI